MSGRFRYLLLAALFLAAALTALLLALRDNRLEATSYEITRAFLRIERAIGYVGFIHHFKNYVLRPGEERYAVLARESLEESQRAVAELRRLVGRSGLEVNLSDLQTTLDLYAAALRDAVAARERGEPITAVDRRVRVSDDAAEISLAQFENEIESLLESRRWWSSVWRWTSLVSLLAVALGLAVGAVHLARQREAALRRQQDDLARERQHSAELQKLVAEVERSNRALDEFAYVASHDLREPLRGIGINLDFLARETLPDKARDRIRRMKDLLGRGERLIAGLLDYARIGLGDRQSEAVDPARVIAEIEAELREWLDERNARIVMATEIPRLLADATQVKTALRNLIVNGLRYNDSDRKVVTVGFLAEADVPEPVRATVTGPALYVRDNGIGIDPRDHDKLFRIFRRLPKSESYGPGSGSGLSFVRKIVREHGSDIAVISEAGAGSTFYFGLPVAEATSAGAPRM